MSTKFICDSCGAIAVVTGKKTLDVPQNWCEERKAGEARDAIAPMYCSEACAEKKSEQQTYSFYQPEAKFSSPTYVGSEPVDVATQASQRVIPTKKAGY